MFSFSFDSRRPRLALDGALVLSCLVAASSLAQVDDPPPDPPQLTGSAQIEVGSGSGLTDEPEVTPGEDVVHEEEFNPTITCTIGENDTIHQLLDCLLDSISNPPVCPPELIIDEPDPIGGGSVDPEPNELPDRPCVQPEDRSDFNVLLLPAPHYGVEVKRLDGARMSRIMFRETDPGLQATQLRIDNSDRLGRIGVVSETPSGAGEVIVRVNDVTVVVSTERYPSAVEVTAQIVGGLRRSGFTVLVEGDFIYLADPGATGLGTRQTLKTGIRRVSLHSTDPAIVASDLALLAPQDPELAVLGRPFP
ncbi:MAG: hypothetical protein AAF533_10860 [Acidobacteriota bacterium]